MLSWTAGADTKPVARMMEYGRPDRRSAVSPLNFQFKIPYFQQMIVTHVRTANIETTFGGHAVEKYLGIELDNRDVSGSLLGGG